MQNDTVVRITEDTSPKIIIDLFQFPYEYFSNKYGNSRDCLLDIACGNGLQTDMLKSKFREVISADVEPQKDFVIEGSVDNIPLSDNSVDWIFSFETLEHIDEESQIKAISEFRRVAKKGFVIGSVKEDGNDFIDGIEIWKAKNGKNPFHLRELDNKKMRQLVDSIPCKQFFQSKYDGHQLSMVDSLTEDDDVYCNYCVVIF